LEQQAQIKTFSSGITSIINGITGLIAVWQIATNLPSIWDNEDLSTGEKI
jgi:hypothetical protein